MIDNPDAGPEFSSVPPEAKRSLTFKLVEVLGVCAIIGVAIAFFLPATRRARPAARRTQCKMNLKQIGLALHNYHDAYGAFPPAYTVDANGKPLHSWRTLLLPFLDRGDLYKKIDFSKPWDDPANAEVARASIPEFNCPSSAAPRDHTSYVAVIGPHSCLRPQKSASIQEITDGTGNTMMVIEVAAEQSVPWISPQDTDESSFLSLGPKSKTSHTGGLHVLLADGAARFLSAALEASFRRALISIDGNDSPGEW